MRKRILLKLGPCHSAADPWRQSHPLPKAQAGWTGHTRAENMRFYEIWAWIWTGHTRAENKRFGFGCKILRVWNMGVKKVGTGYRFENMDLCFQI